jgi:TPR repeat protein
VDPILRLVERLKKVPPASFGDVAVLAENLDLPSGDSGREEVKAFLAKHIFAEEHFALAMGRLYASERVNDADSANFWFHKAIAMGAPGGMVELGISHLLGRGLPVDTEEGYRWLARARAENDGSGAFLAAICRMQGVGITQNLPMARELLNVAIDLRCREAYWESSRMHEEGLGGPVDADWALRQCKEGAALGETKCMERLAALYEKGEVVPRDLAKAQELRDGIRRSAGRTSLREIASRIEALPMDHPAPAAVTPAPQAWIRTASDLISWAGGLFRQVRSPGGHYAWADQEP